MNQRNIGFEAKKYSAKILNHKLQIGQFEVIEQLLDVKGIETNNLERIK